MRCSESSHRRWPVIQFRGWIHQETLCNRSSVAFDLRQCAAGLIVVYQCASCPLRPAASRVVWHVGGHVLETVIHRVAVCGCQREAWVPAQKGLRMSRTQNHNVPTRSDCSAHLQEWLELRQPFQQYCDTKPWEQLVIEDVLVVNVARWMLESPLRGAARRQDGVWMAGSQDTTLTWGQHILWRATKSQRMAGE